MPPSERPQTHALDRAATGVCGLIRCHFFFKLAMWHSSNFVANLLCPVTKLDSSAGFFSFCSFSLLLRPYRIFLSWLRQISLTARPEFMKLTFCHRHLLYRLMRNWMLRAHTHTHTHWRGNYKHLSVYAYLNCIGLPQKLFLNDVVREYLCDVLCEQLLNREIVHSIRPFAIRRPSRVGFYSGFPQGNFSYVDYVYIYLELTYSGMYVHTYTPCRDEDSYCRSPYDICYKRIRWIIFIFDHCYLLLAVIQLILCIHYKQFLRLPTGPINLWSMFEILLEGVALGWTHLPNKSRVLSCLEMVLKYFLLCCVLHAFLAQDTVCI